MSSNYRSLSNSFIASTKELSEAEKASIPKTKAKTLLAAISSLRKLLLYHCIVEKAKIGDTCFAKFF